MKLLALALALVLGGCGGAKPAAGAPAGTGGGARVDAGGGEPRTDGASPTERSPAPPTLDSRALVGPVASIDAFCAGLGTGIECDDRNAFAVPPAPAPYLDVKILEVVDRDSRVGYCDIAVRTDSGWFATRQHQVCAMEEPHSGGMVTEVSYAERSAGHPVIEVTTKLEGVSGGVTYEESTLVLCGLAMSGVPACTAPMVTYRYTLDADGGEDERELSVTVRPDGTVALRGRLGDDDVDTAVPLRF